MITCNSFLVIELDIKCISWYKKFNNLIMNCYCCHNRLKLKQKLFFSNKLICFDI